MCRRTASPFQASGLLGGPDYLGVSLGPGKARVGNAGLASCAIFISSSRDGPRSRVGSAMLASMAWPCQETERVSAWAETANALVNATVKKTDNPRMRLSP